MKEALDDSMLQVHASTTLNSPKNQTECTFEFASEKNKFQGYMELRVLSKLSL